MTAAERREEGINGEVEGVSVGPLHYHTRRASDMGSGPRPSSHFNTFVLAVRVANANRLTEPSPMTMSQSPSQAAEHESPSAATWIFHRLVVPRD